MTSADYESLRRSLSTSDGMESAAFLVCGISSTTEHQKHLVRDVLPVPEDGYIQRFLAIWGEA